MSEHNKNKPRINKFVKGATVALIASSLAIGTVYTIAEAKTDNYSSQNQIEKIADGLDCDITVMKLFANNNDHVIRLKHNDGDPIYVNFEEGYPENYENMAKNSLDYVFKMVGGVNSLYSQYELVDENQSEELKEQGKTVIEYTLNQGDDNKKVGFNSVAAYMDSESKTGDFFHFLTNKSVVVNPEICVNLEILEKSKDEESATRSFTHELFHVFGFGDVYTDVYNFETSKFYGNTFMKAGNEFPLATPNDYACIMSAYAKPMENKKELNSYIEKCKSQIEAYKDYYYSQLEEFAESNRQSKPIANGTRESIDGQIESDFSFWSINSENVRLNDYMHVVCSGDNYIITITDEDNNVVDTVTGKARLVNGAYVLENVEFSTNYRPNSDLEYDGYITDFVLTRTDVRDYLFNVAEDRLHHGNVRQNTINNETLQK